MLKRLQLRTVSSLIMVAFMAAISFGILREIDEFWADSKSERIDVAESAIKRAALQCYALEGSYPSDLKYLEDNYGIILNEERYFYQYEIFASNIMPEIVVLEKPR